MKNIAVIQRVEFIEKRNTIAKRYDQLLNNLPVVTPWHNPNGYSGNHLYVIRLKLKDIHKTHKEVYKSLMERGIGVNLHYIPIYRQPYYEQMGFVPGLCPESEKYFTEAISIPIYTGLTMELQDKVVDSIQKVLKV